MESYIANTQAFLGIVQATISDSEFKRSCEAGEKMYEAFSTIANEYGLNMREMLNAVLSINVGILEVMQEQLKEMKEKE